VKQTAAYENKAKFSNFAKKKKQESDHEMVFILSVRGSKFQAQK